MTTRFQLRRGTASEHATFTGAVGEVTYDTDLKTARVHDGSVSGGRIIARADVSNVSNPQFDGIYSLKLPTGTTAQRPSSPVNGQMRYNSSNGFVEVYSNGAWMPNDVVAKATMAEFTSQVTLSATSGDGTCVSGTYTKTYGTQTNVMAFVNGRGRDNQGGHAGMFFEFGGTRKYEFVDYAYSDYDVQDVIAQGIFLFTGQSAGSKSYRLGWNTNDGNSDRPAIYWNANQGTSDSRARNQGTNILFLEVKAV